MTNTRSPLVSHVLSFALFLGVFVIPVFVFTVLMARFQNVSLPLCAAVIVGSLIGIVVVTRKA